MRLQGKAGVVDTATVERELEAMPKKRGEFRVEDIFNKDETSRSYRCLPLQSYVSIWGAAWGTRHQVHEGQGLGHGSSLLQRHRDGKAGCRPYWVVQGADLL